MSETFEKTPAAVAAACLLPAFPSTSCSIILATAAATTAAAATAATATTAAAAAAAATTAANGISNNIGNGDDTDISLPCADDSIVMFSHLSSPSSSTIAQEQTIGDGVVIEEGTLSTSDVCTGIPDVGMSNGLFVPPSLTVSVPPPLSVSVPHSLTVSVPHSSTVSVPPSLSVSVPPSLSVSVPPPLSVSVPPSLSVSIPASDLITYDSRCHNHNRM